jgi:16S rRNA (guanine527-N7)-methyltransferase
MEVALWNDLAKRAGATLSPEQHELLSRYLDLLVEANQTMNLTRIVTREAAEVGHIGDALTLLPFLPKQKIRVADVGTGGGVPGLPLASARPDIHVTLIEATKKKADFLRRVADTLPLLNLNVVAQRAEEAGINSLRETFDIVTARAVGELVWLAEWCLPLAKKGGKVLAMKGAKIKEELPVARKAILILGGIDPVVHPVALPGAEHHVIVEIRKTGFTKKGFPRAASVAKGKPLV